MLVIQRSALRTTTAAASANAPRAGDARTLYLSAASCHRVDANDDSLVVSAQRNTAPLRRLRFPLHRVARVVSSTTVDWSGSALQLCMRRQLCICWLDDSGETIGSLHSHLGACTALATAIDLLLETHAGLERYQQWLKSRRMHVQLQWGRTSSAGISPQQWELSKRNWVYRAEIDVHLPAAVHPLLAAWVASEFQERQLLPVQVGPDGEPVNLARDVTWLLWGEMNLCCGSMADNVEQLQEATLLFERWRAVNASTLLLHMASLSRVANKEAYA